MTQAPGGHEDEFMRRCATKTGHLEKLPTAAFTAAALAMWVVSTPFWPLFDAGHRHTGKRGDSTGILGCFAPVLAFAPIDVLGFGGSAPPDVIDIRCILGMGSEAARTSVMRGMHTHA